MYSYAYCPVEQYIFVWILFFSCITSELLPRSYCRLCYSKGQVKHCMVFLQLKDLHAAHSEAVQTAALAAHLL